MSLFEILEAEDRAEEERVSGSRAIIAAQQRVAKKFSTFLSKSRTNLELTARASLIEPQVWQIVADACSEYDCDDHQKVFTAVAEVLAGGHSSGCECGFCANKGKLPGSKKDDSDSDEKEESDDDEGDGDEGKPWEKKADAADAYERTCDNCSECAEGKHCRSCPQNDSPGSVDDLHEARTAADAVETGDSYTHERVDLGASETGLGAPSPKIDKKRPAGDAVDGTHIKPIDIPSQRHPSVQQGVPDAADYNTTENWDARSPVVQTQSPDKETGLDAGPHTDTWSGMGGLTDAVTNEALNSFTSKWRVIDL